MSKYGVRSEYEYNATHKRDCITVWSGPFYPDYEATGLALPGNAGYMLTLYFGGKVRVECPCPRTDENYQEVDAAVCAAMDRAEGRD